jgi:multicomponent Na+:H+ antiporter subunit E
MRLSHHGLGMPQQTERGDETSEGCSMSNFQEISWSTVASRSLLFALVWWMLTEGDAQSWWFGIPAVTCAMIVSMALLPAVPLVWRELPGFTPFFLWRSLQGGGDVAWRAFHPGMPIAPAVIDHPLGLPEGLPQVLMVNIVSLLPGTLSTALDGRVLRVHVLDSRGNFLTELKAVEHRVAKLCGVSQTTSHGGK